MREDLDEFAGLVAAIIFAVLVWAVSIAVAVAIGVTVLRWMGVL